MYKKVSRNKELMDWFDSMVGLDDVRFFSLYKLFRSIHISSSSLKTLSQFRTWSSRHGGPEETETRGHGSEIRVDPSPLSSETEMIRSVFFPATLKR